MELYYPQIMAQAGGYSFAQGIEIEVCSARSSHFDWAKIRFTEPFQPEIALARKDPAAVFLGYDGVLSRVFTGYVAKPYNGGDRTNEVSLKDDMLLLEETIINDTFLSATPQELISAFLAKAGVSNMELSSKSYPRREVLPIRRQNAVQAIETVNAAWGLRLPFFFSDGVFYWGEEPKQEKIYTFEYGVNILHLERMGGIWDLETVSVPFVKHSHKIDIIHPRVSGEQRVSKVVSSTNDSGFIRTHIYF
ncbi:serine/arginine repetitive matrix protein 2 [uncultured Oscillibacter sp.]|uniref:serine/arginine repetitive matrix protein 2 n=1 Tax=uncultured Oscillibacter sp. TaxID=876091 RepID=UPI0025EABA0D|nr:serine/arginine repetitive matrix protein 2 [uncultured Oscillibacter sp.]